MRIVKVPIERELWINLDHVSAFGTTGWQSLEETEQLFYIRVGLEFMTFEGAEKKSVRQWWFELMENKNE